MSKLCWATDTHPLYKSFLEVASLGHGILAELGSG